MPKLPPGAERKWTRDPARTPLPLKYGTWAWNAETGRWKARLNDRGQRLVLAWMRKFRGTTVPLVAKSKATRGLYRFAINSGHTPEEVDAALMPLLCEAVARYRRQPGWRPGGLVGWTFRWLKMGLLALVHRRAGQPWDMVSLDKDQFDADSAWGESWSGRRSDVTPDPKADPVGDEHRSDAAEVMGLLTGAVAAVGSDRQIAVYHMLKAGLMKTEVALLFGATDQAVANSVEKLREKLVPHLSLHHPEELSRWRKVS